jgi:hypothetical protein
MFVSSGNLLVALRVGGVTHSNQAVPYSGFLPDTPTTSVLSASRIVTSSDIKLYVGFLISPDLRIEVPAGKI